MQVRNDLSFAFCHLVDHDLDLTPFHVGFKNDVEGAPAFYLAVLIKIILLKNPKTLTPTTRDFFMKIYK